MAGWRWENKPSFELPGETGRLVFEIEVDENGEIIKLVALERGLSPQAEKKCRDEILKLNLLPNGEKTPTISKGKITIVVKAQ